MNGFEPAETIRKYRKSGPFTFPLVMNGKGTQDIAKKYRVTFFPTTYILDGKGRVAARFVGYDEKTERDMRAALVKLGLKPR